MILTKKVKHGRDFSEELKKARLVAELAIKHRYNSSASVKHVGLNADVANQILRKYRKKGIKKVKRVKLTIPGRNVRMIDSSIYIPCFKLKVKMHFLGFIKINQVEIDNDYLFVSCTVEEAPAIEYTSVVGVDRNSTGHSCVVANPDTGKVLKLGKSLQHISNKYDKLTKKIKARNLSKKSKKRAIDKLKRRRDRIKRDINHKISKKVVQFALENNAAISMENLKGIKKSNRRKRKEQRFALNSWSHHQLKLFIEYKAKLLGVPVFFVDPAYTSQDCSKCGTRGKRSKKSFKCPSCGHAENADVNAAFNIANRVTHFRLSAERDADKRSTDALQDSWVESTLWIRIPGIYSGE